MLICKKEGQKVRFVGNAREINRIARKLGTQQKVDINRHNRYDVRNVPATLVLYTDGSSIVTTNTFNVLLSASDMSLTFRELNDATNVEDLKPGVQAFMDFMGKSQVGQTMFDKAWDWKKAAYGGCFYER